MVVIVMVVVLVRVKVKVKVKVGLRLGRLEKRWEKEETLFSIFLFFRFLNLISVFI